MPARRIEIVDVAARDGLQNEPGIVATPVKVELINRLVAAGIRRLEAASFVNPKRVPQMADAEAVMAALPRRDDVTYIGLVLNGRGFDRARAAGCREVNYALVATDTFSKRNQGTTTEEGIAVYREIAKAAHAAGVRCSLTITVAFGCPFEGEVPPERVLGLIERAAGPETFEIGLADTIGCAAPSEVARLFREVARRAPGKRLRAHFHNTRNTGIANCYAAVEAGVHTVDASLGGIGGCPFAPAATGNVPTEDVVYMLSRMGVETGVDIAALLETTAWLEGQIGRKTPALVSRAGLFPPASVRTA
jgi:hydroxymethylglutaryl-CoA lyase